MLLHVVLNWLKPVAWHPSEACVQTAKASGAMWDLKLAAGGIKLLILQMLLIFDTLSASGELNRRVPAN